MPPTKYDELRDLVTDIGADTKAALEISKHCLRCLQGNGQGGLKTDVAVLKERVESLCEDKALAKQQGVRDRGRLWTGLVGTAIAGLVGFAIANVMQ